VPKTGISAVPAITRCSVFNQFGDVERCALTPGNVHSADGWRAVLEPVIARYRRIMKRLYFRGDAAFGNPEMYEFLEAERIGYKIRLPTNSVLQRRVGHDKPDRWVHWPGCHSTLATTRLVPALRLISALIWEKPDYSAFPSFIPNRSIAVRVEGPRLSASHPRRRLALPPYGPKVSLSARFNLAAPTPRHSRRYSG